MNTRNGASIPTTHKTSAQDLVPLTRIRRRVRESCGAPERQDLLEELSDSLASLRVLEPYASEVSLPWAAYSRPVDRG